MFFLITLVPFTKADVWHIHVVIKLILQTTYGKQNRTGEGPSHVLVNEGKLINSYIKCVIELHKFRIYYK